MLEARRPLQKTITVPPQCRERYVPLEHRLAMQWRELAIHHSGVSHLVPGYRVGVLDQTSLMLIATTHGAGWARTATDDFALVPGSLLINVPGEGIEFGIRDRQWSMVWWYMRPQPAWGWLLDGTTRCERFAHGRLLFDMTDALITRLVAVKEAGTPSRLASDDSDADPVARHLSETVISHLRELAHAPAIIDDPLVRLWDEIQGRLHEPWPVSAIAARLKVSVPTLQRQVHRRFGKSSHQLLVHLRMVRARELLRRTTYPLRVIAEQVGFTDPFAFSAAFRRRYGRSPSSLRPG
jgi:AraC-like DNA-binding protein